MANYNNPRLGNIPFRFSSSGYNTPNFSDVRFNFKTHSSYQQTATLQAAISVMQLYHDTTYTYVKECRSIVVGYSANNVQILKLPCLFGGIRDLFSFVHVITTDTNKDLLSFIRPNYYSYVDLSSFYRVFFRKYSDLTAYTKCMFGTQIPVDLGGYLQDIQPVDLNSLLNIIEIRDLSSYLNGVWWHGYTDLSALFMKFFLRHSKNLSSYIHGWQESVLYANIIPFWVKDLSADINAGLFSIPKDLLSNIYAVSPKNLHATVHGYDTKNLPVYITYGLGPYDLQGSIRPILPKNLPAVINGFTGIKSTQVLKAYISGYKYFDLCSYINSIGYKELSAFVNATGKYKDLTTYIVPKTINIKHVILVSLLESRDLSAVINYDCKLSGYCDLPSRLYLIHKKDLKSYIIGWYHDSADNVVDLKAYINTGVYTAVDTYNISFSAHSYHHEEHDILGGSSKNYKLFDTYTILGGNAFKDLVARVICVSESSDLTAFIRPAPLANYTPVPNWLKPKNREVVINIRRFEARWRRFVELMFFTNSDKDYHYFYVSGSNKVYRVDKNRTWVIWVTGYSYDKNSIYDRINVRRKFIFNLKKYNTIDDAIRDMLDRVSELRRRNLPATIQGIVGYYHKDLTSNIFAKYKKTWVLHLPVIIKGSAVMTKDLSVKVRCV